MKTKLFVISTLGMIAVILISMIRQESLAFAAVFGIAFFLIPFVMGSAR